MKSVPRHRHVPPGWSETTISKGKDAGIGDQRQVSSPSHGVQPQVKSNFVDEEVSSGLSQLSWFAGKTRGN